MGSEVMSGTTGGGQDGCLPSGTTGGGQDGCLPSGTTGGGQDGCLPFTKCHAASVFGATPLDRSIWQALSVIPARPRETAESITFL